jgi:hypothetical protein
VESCAWAIDHIGEYDAVSMADGKADCSPLSTLVRLNSTKKDGAMDGPD